MRTGGVYIPLIALLPSIALSQIVSNLPQCWQNCIKNSGDFSCDALDLSCICKLSSSSSSSNFLTATVTCIKSTCDNSLDVNDLLTPLQLACNLAGQPIPDSAITSAENAATTSKTMSFDNGYYTLPSTVTPGTVYGYTSYSTDGLGDSQSSAAATSFFAQTTYPTVATTVSTLVTDSDGNTVGVLVPVTIEMSTTIYGTPETQSISGSATSTSTSALSTSTAITTASMTSMNSMTYTTSTTFDGAALTSSIESDISAARSSASAASSTASASASTTSSSNGVSGSGSPFDQQGSAGGAEETRCKILLAVAMIVAVGVIWY